MQLSNQYATVGLVATATPQSTNVYNDNVIGVQPRRVSLPSTVAYSLRAVLADSAATLTVALSTGVASGGTFAAGAPQVETATAAGTITASGNATVTVTSFGMTGSPLAISVPVLEGDTASVWAAKIRTALSETSVISGRFDVSGTGTAIVLTRKTFAVGGVDLYLYGNDATLNVSITNGTSTGITAAATSANTTTGVSSSGVKIFDGGGEDFEGNTIPALTDVDAILVECSSESQVTFTTLGLSSIPINAGFLLMQTQSTSALEYEDIIVTGEAIEVVLTVFGS